MARPRPIVGVSEVDPICAMQAYMDGFEVVSPSLIRTVEVKR